VKNYLILLKFSPAAVSPVTINGAFKIQDDGWCHIGMSFLAINQRLIIQFQSNFA